jgi:DNA-directed RNA polymerase specialized sigma24 family protein
MSQQDSDLIQRARNGDVEAVRELIEGRYADLYRFCRRMLASQADAEAATRQILGLALTGEAVASRMESIALDVCRTWLERRHHDSLPADELGTGDRHAEAATESDDARLLAALDRLPVDLRVPLLHRCLWGLAAADSARLLGVSEKLLGVRLEDAWLRIGEDTGIEATEVEGRLRAQLAAMPIPEEHRRTILEQALGAQEKRRIGLTVLTAVLTAIAFVVAVLVFVA